jgi:hypothetical protein
LKANINCSLIVVIKRGENFNQLHLISGRHWFFKALRVDHEIAHSELTATPKTKMKYYENCLLIVVIRRGENFNQLHLITGRHWFFKALRVDHEIAHFDLTATPKTKMKYYEDLP